METITALLGQPEEVEPVSPDATFFAVGEEDGQVVVTVTGQPDLANPTWGVILD